MLSVFVLGFSLKTFWREDLPCSYVTNSAKLLSQCFHQTYHETWRELHNHLKHFPPNHHLAVMEALIADATGYLKPDHCKSIGRR